MFIARTFGLSPMNEQFDKIKLDAVKNKTALNDVLDPEVSNDLLESVADLFNQCFDLYENAKRGMLTSPRKPSVNHKDDGTIHVEPEDNVSQVAERVSVTSSSTFIARQVKLYKKRAELEARLAFAKAEAEAKQKHALEIAKAEEQLKTATDKLYAKEKLIALFERGLLVAVSSKVGPIDSLITLMGRRLNFCEVFRADSKLHLKKMQLGNCAGEKSSSLLEGSVNENGIRFKNDKSFSRENFCRECTSSSKCDLCEPHFGRKHSTALHELYVNSDLVNLGAASAEHAQTLVTPGAGKKQAVVRKLAFNNDLVMLRTTAVRIVNSVTGKSTLAYAQHDTTSQATLILKSLRDKLGVAINTDHAMPFAS